jgi:hypothetical protein
MRGRYSYAKATEDRGGEEENGRRSEEVKR